MRNSINKNIEVGERNKRFLILWHMIAGGGGTYFTICSKLEYYNFFEKGTYIKFLKSRYKNLLKLCYPFFSSPGIRLESRTNFSVAIWFS